MFAFGVFDERTGELVLVRDQLGIKPLFFARGGRGLVFCSELKALAEALGPDTAVDDAAMVASLLYYWVPDTRCACAGRREAASRAAGSRCRPDGQVERGSYWSLREVAEQAAATSRSPTWPRSSRTRRSGTSWPTSRWRRSCPAGWTPAT